MRRMSADQVCDCCGGKFSMMCEDCVAGRHSHGCSFDPSAPLEPGPARDPICGACVEGLDWGHVNPACKSSNKVGGPKA